MMPNPRYYYRPRYKHHVCQSDRMTNVLLLLVAALFLLSALR